MNPARLTHVTMTDTDRNPDPNVNCRTVRALEGDAGENLRGPGLGDDVRHSPRGLKKRTDRLDFVESKTSPFQW